MNSFQKVILTDIDKSFPIGLKLINSLELNLFLSIIKEVFTLDEDSYNTFETKIRTTFNDLNLNKDEEVCLLKTLYHLKTKTEKFIMKPKDLQEYLTDSLKLDNAKAEIFIKVWCLKPNNVLQNVAGKELNGTAWTLCAEIMKNGEFTSPPNAKGNLQLSIKNNSNDEEHVHLNLEHGQLSQLYRELESIQKVLDCLKS